MRTFRSGGWLLGLLSISSAWLGLPAVSRAEHADVVVYGATPGGIAAALSAATGGARVALVEPTPRIGGLVTSGLSHSDFRTLEGLNGAFLEFARRVEAYYVATYGADSPQVRDSFHGTFAEPKVNLAVFEQMLAEQPNIRVRPALRLTAVQVDRDQPRRIRSATFRSPDGGAVTFEGQMFIDGSYEGDLMAQCGVAWRAGREGQSEYGESLAPPVADNQLQAYNFRFIMTRDAANRIAPVAPRGYAREDFLDVVPLLSAGKFRQVFSYPTGCIFKAQTPPLPNGKYDINDVSNGLVRLSLPGRNLPWPNGDAATRQQVFDEHVRDQVGLLYFLQHDEAVPARFRDEARQWGWCRDEFTETRHLPPQLYIREARRMIGVRVYVQQDSECAPNDARAVLHPDAIAMGDYGHNCHGTDHEGPRFGGRHVGEFYQGVPPYQVPYGVLLPREMDNLLVPVAASSSHVGFCALRLEPIWMSLGRAAGHAAAMGLADGVNAHQVSVPRLQTRLHADHAATIYISDVAPDSPDFAMVQWWGTYGGWHGLERRPSKPGERGANLHGQYYAAYPYHAAQLDLPLDEATLERWRQVADALRLPRDRLPAANGQTTRRDYVAAAWQARSSAP